MVAFIKRDRAIQFHERLYQFLFYSLFAPILYSCATTLGWSTMFRCQAENSLPRKGRMGKEPYGLRLGHGPGSTIPILHFEHFISCLALGNLYTQDNNGRQIINGGRAVAEKGICHKSFLG
jgi:hypothetical protein